MVEAVKRNTHKTFFSGVLLLTLSTVLVKLIGLFYKIPMLSYLGTEGMGYFNTALELYALLCALSTAGLPVAMSVLISDTRHRDMPLAARRLGVRRIFSVALVTFMVVGCWHSSPVHSRPCSVILRPPLRWWPLRQPFCLSACPRPCEATFRGRET